MIPKVAASENYNAKCRVTARDRGKINQNCNSSGSRFPRRHMYAPPTDAPPLPCRDSRPRGVPARGGISLFKQDVTYRAPGVAPVAVRRPGNAFPVGADAFPRPGVGSSSPCPTASAPRLHLTTAATRYTHVSTMSLSVQGFKGIGAAASMRPRDYFHQNFHLQLSVSCLDYAGWTPSPTCPTAISRRCRPPRPGAGHGHMAAGTEGSNVQSSEGRIIYGRRDPCVWRPPPPPVPQGATGARDDSEATILLFRFPAGSRFWVFRFP